MFKTTFLGVGYTVRHINYHYKPRKPTIDIKQTTVANAVGSKAASPTIMNGAKGTPTFPKGTLVQTIKQRSPYFLFGLLATSCIVGWPFVFLTGSDAVHHVPPKLLTALVQKTEEGLTVGDIQHVHRDIPDDGDE